MKEHKDEILGVLSLTFIALGLGMLHCELDKIKPFECTGFRCGKRFSEAEIMGLINGKEE